VILIHMATWLDSESILQASRLHKRGPTSLFAASTFMALQIALLLFFIVPTQFSTVMGFENSDELMASCVEHAVVG